MDNPLSSAAMDIGLAEEIVDFGRAGCNDKWHREAASSV
jgi:hypothetical protein